MPAPAIVRDPFALTDRHALPLIFLHRGFEPYLAYTLWQARKTNPASPVYLLGDESNDLTSLGVSHVRYCEFAQEAGEFVSVYRHLSGHEPPCERLCFERWFYLQSFLRKTRIEEFCFLDSDYALLKDLAEVRGPWQGYDMAGAPVWAFSFFRSPGVVERFCSFVLDRYRDENQIRQWQKPAPGVPTTPQGTQWINDMTLWMMFIKASGLSHLDLRQPRDGIVFDGGLASSDGIRMRSGFKQLTVKKKAVFGRLEKTGQPIQFAGLHLQGKFPKRLWPLLAGFPLPLLRACTRPPLSRNGWKLVQMISYCWFSREHPLKTP